MDILRIYKPNLGIIVLSISQSWCRYYVPIQIYKTAQWLSIRSFAKMRLHVLLVLCGSILVCINSQTATLIKDYLNGNNLNTALLITCDSQNNFNAMETLLTLQYHRIWISVWDISHESPIADYNYDQFFMRLSNTHCVVVDGDCNQTSSFMSEVSSRILFHYERHWLIFSSSFNESIDILGQQNINVDAEVSLAIPVERTDHDNYDIYEVYNPSSKHKGRLNVTRSGYWSKRTGLNMSQNQTKIERRRNMQGITFSSVITVRIASKKKLFLNML